MVVIGRYDGRWALTTVISIFTIIPLICVIGTSYDSYVSSRTFFDATKTQYSDAITMYHDYAQIDTERAFVDFQYQGYQENIAGFIKDFRNRMIKYNELIISKRVMDRNIFFSWVIIAPDEDMVPLQLTKKE